MLQIRAFKRCWQLTTQRTAQSVLIILKTNFLSSRHNMKKNAFQFRSNLFDTMLSEVINLDY